MLFASGSIASAQQPNKDGADDAASYLRARQDRVQKLLGKPARTKLAKQRRAKQLDSAVKGLLDYKAVSKQSLRDHWGSKSASQQQEFVRLLQRLVEQNYRSNLERTSAYKVDYGPAKKEGDSIVVSTSARSKSDRRAPPVQIDYRLKRTSDGWTIIDIVTDGVSMVRNYRSQFGRILKKEGWSGLVKRMKSRINDSADTAGRLN